MPTDHRAALKEIHTFPSLVRYVADTGTYLPKRAAPKCGDFRTVIVDECSMPTEDQLAALFDALTNVERFALVGGPHQLPPIGAGRPFVDIVKEMAPKDAGALFPRYAPGYAELTIPRRQKGAATDDVLLASHFSGLPLDPGADAVWDRAASRSGDRLKVVPWSDPQDLQKKIVDELVQGLELTGPDDELGFELSLGGSRFKELERAFFWNRFGDNPGAASKIGEWQILSPVHAGLEGVGALNRSVQERFRGRWREIATSRFLEEGLIHRTERGELVRSKSELVIADKLHARGIDYAYEQPLVLSDGRVRYPDFTIADRASGITYYWEHLGMLDDPAYRARWKQKRAEYLAAGIAPHEQGGGTEGTLIETRDDSGGGLDAGKIALVIDKVILSLLGNPLARTLPAISPACLRSPRTRRAAYRCARGCPVP